MNKYVNTDKNTGEKYVLTKSGKRFDVIQKGFGPKMNTRNLASTGNNTARQAAINLMKTWKKTEG